MYEEAKVAKINGKTIYVTLKKKPECETCKACSFGNQKEVTVPALSKIDCRVGDRVRIKMPEAKVSIAPLILYAMPLVFMIIGALIGLLISQTAAIFMAFIFLAIAGVIGYLLDKLIFRKKHRYVPQIVERLS